MRMWIAVLSLVLLVGCSSKSPPQPLVSVGKVTVPVVLSTHCWTDGCADYPAPEEHLKAVNYHPIPLPSDADPVSIKFSTVPPQGFTVTHWWNGKPDPLNKVSGRDLNISTTGLVPGLHTFSISARWKQGSATHIFQLEVPRQ